MTLSASDIVAIVQAGGSVDIDPSGAIRITGGKAKSGRAERNRRAYEKRLNATENDLIATESTEMGEIQAPPAPPLPPTPVKAHNLEAGPDLFAATSIPVAAHKRITWNPEQGWQGITDIDRGHFSKAAPAIDLDRQLSAADLWLRANPTKAKKNFYRFFVNWITRQQERGGDAISNRPASSQTRQQSNLRQFAF